MVRDKTLVEAACWALVAEEHKVEPFRTVAGQHLLEVPPPVERLHAALTCAAKLWTCAVNLKTVARAPTVPRAGQ